MSFPSNIQDLRSGPRAESYYLDERGEVTFTTGESYPLEKTIVNFRFSTPHVLRLDKIGQEISSDLVLDNLTWHLYINERLEVNYAHITNILGRIFDPSPIEVFQTDINSFKLTAEYSVAPIADATLKARLIGYATMMNQIKDLKASPIILPSDINRWLMSRG